MSRPSDDDDTVDALHTRPASDHDSTECSAGYSSSLAAWRCCTRPTSPGKVRIPPLHRLPMTIRPYLIPTCSLHRAARVQAKVGGYELERVWGTPVPANVRPSPRSHIGPGTLTPARSRRRLLQVALEAFAGFANLVLGVLATAPALKGVSFASEMSSRSVRRGPSDPPYRPLKS